MNSNKSKNNQKTKKSKFFFGQRIQKIATKVDPAGFHLDTISKLHEFEQSIPKRISSFETLFLKASPKLREIIKYNPHVQAFLMGAKPSMWITFEEMFPGNMETWLRILKVKNLFYERSLSVILDELASLKPHYIKIKEDFIVDVHQVKHIISNNLDIFAEMRKKPYLAVSNEETTEIIKKIGLQIEMGRLPQVRNMLGLILGYPRKQVLLHKIIDKLDLQILIPKMNDFSRFGFYDQTMKKEKLETNRSKLTEIFTHLESLEKKMNEEAVSFEEQKAIHQSIIHYLKENTKFLRKIVFKHYFLNGISQTASDTIDNYILLSFPRLSFPQNIEFADYGMFWVEYQPEKESDYIRAKILLAVKHVCQWKKLMHV